MARDRSFCAQCNSRGYTNDMTLMFKHKLIAKKGIYVCRWGSCEGEYCKALQLNKSTGKLSIIINI